LLERLMAERARTYWLTQPARLRRKDNTVVLDLADGRSSHIPVTDIADIVALEPLDINTAAVTLLRQHDIVVHLTDHYGNYAGALAPASTSCSGAVVRAQVKASENPAQQLRIARAFTESAAHNLYVILGRSELASAYEVFQRGCREAATSEQLMAAEGNFRGVCWTRLDERLPDWLRLEGRSRRPPRNAGNALVSFLNGLVYSRCVSALRMTPLHLGIGFLHATTTRQRYTLALDVAEPMKPLLTERLMLRLAGRNQLTQGDFDSGAAQSTLSDQGRRKVLESFRDLLTSTVQHPTMKRRVAFEELIRFDAWRLTRHFLEGEQFYATKAWW
jgi:CRISPR-associated protein Cas1